jgi:hypothetical protein
MNPTTRGIRASHREMSAKVVVDLWTKLLNLADKAAIVDLF